MDEPLKTLISKYRDALADSEPGLALLDQIESLEEPHRIALRLGYVQGLLFKRGYSSDQLYEDLKTLPEIFDMR